MPSHEFSRRRYPTRVLVKDRFQLPDILAEACLTLLIFDCDGVLIDSEILHSEVESALGGELLGINRDPLTHAQLFAGKGLQNLLAVWAEESGRPLPPQIEAEMARRKRDVFTTQLKAIPYVAETLQALAHFPRCVASGTPVPTLEIALKATGLYDFFAPHLFSSDMVARGKPAPDVFLYAAKVMSTQPNNCVVIEDSEHGVRAALAAGMRVVGFAGGSHCDALHAEKLRGAEQIIKDMRALPDLLGKRRA